MQVNTRDVPLLPGAQAPEFRVARFVKGSPVAALEPGQIYVLEFWATWCGPCIENIPHISALQAEHPDVVFIGIAIDKEKSVEDFVAQSGERMAYRVALDHPLAEADGTGSSWMKTKWLAAAERTGIPDAFIVDGAGRISWIGYPSEIGDVLPRIKDGSWDVPAFRQEYAAQVAEVAQMRANLAALSGAAEAHDWTTVVAQCEALLSTPSGMEPMLISEKLKALGHLDVRRARDYAEAEFVKADGRQGMSTHIALARACSTLVQELSAAGNAAEAAEFSRMGLRYIDAVKVAFEDLQKLDPQSASPFQAAKILQERAALLEADGRLAEAVSDAKACIAILVEEGADEFADMIEPLSSLIARCLDAAPEDKAGVVGRVERQQRGSATVVCEGDVCRIVSH